MREYKPLDVRAIGFKSAGDLPKRDPDSVKVILISENGEKYQLNYDLDFNYKRWHTIIMPEIEPKIPDVVEATFLLQNSKMSYTQLGEIIFYG